MMENQPQRDARAAPQLETSPQHCKYGLGRPFGCRAARNAGPQATPDFAKARDHGLSRFPRWNEPPQLGANPLRRELALHQFRKDRKSTRLNSSHLGISY